MSFNSLIADASPADAARAAQVMAQDALDDPKTSEEARQRAEEVVSLSLSELTQRIRFARAKRGGGGSNQGGAHRAALVQPTGVGDQPSAVIGPDGHVHFVSKRSDHLAIVRSAASKMVVERVPHEFNYRLVLWNVKHAAEAALSRDIVLRSDALLQPRDLGVFICHAFGDNWTIWPWQPALDKAGLGERALDDPIESVGLVDHPWGTIDRMSM